jgi:hypothetical protein
VDFATLAENFLIRALVSNSLDLSIINNALGGIISYMARAILFIS